MLLSSAYNGLTQKVDKSLLNLGYETYFQVASSEAAMRAGVNAFSPDLIICPTLMKAIPEDIYSKIKCLIVHPGIKGDRGPSSIDWAILNRDKEWGVTIVEADKEMDAGAIWATENFPIKDGQSKVEIYNS
jgi:putative two-component system protein, hydrogenase maturation factor HypX/HoxX